MKEISICTEHLYSGRVEACIKGGSAGREADTSLDSNRWRRAGEMTACIRKYLDDFAIEPLRCFKMTSVQHPIGYVVFEREAREF